MVGVFGRSLSFPNKIPNRQSKPPISHHIRSISLPCRSHPLISHLKDDIIELKTHISVPKNQNSGTVLESLSQLKNIHDTLDDILQLPPTQELFRHKSQWVEKLLEDFLIFIDVYGTFQTSILVFKEEHMSAQVAVRKRDESKIILYVKARNKMAKELRKLISTLRTKSTRGCNFSVSLGDPELASVIMDITQLTMSVTVLLFNGIFASFRSRKWLRWRLSKNEKLGKGMDEFRQDGVESLWGLRKKGDEEVRMILKRMQVLESCICSIENGSERVFRSLINTRVSLLNSLTQ